MMHDAQRTTRTVVLLLFFGSGAAGLVYEVTWTRAFGTVFGNTVFAVGAVLTAFMLGLALGSWLLGSIADAAPQPLRTYALLELGIGAYAFAFPHVLRLTDLLYAWLFRTIAPGPGLLNLVRFILSIAILLVPTILMGGTLPILSRLWSVSATLRPEQADSQRSRSNTAHASQGIGLLYAINTLGAVLGSFAAGFLLIRTVGVRSTIYLAAATSILIALTALVVSGLIGRDPNIKPHAPPRRRPITKAATSAVRHWRIPAPAGDNIRTIVLAAVAVAGFCSLACEVLWTRVLVFVLGTSTYAFACMLTCFILGLAVGAFITSRLLIRRTTKPILWLAILQLLVALAVLASIRLSALIGRFDYALISRFHIARFDKLTAGGFWPQVAVHFIDAALVLLIPAVIMGCIFPMAIQTCARSVNEIGRRVGQVYAWNTIGCVLGSFVAGFVMVPLLGLRNSFLLIVAVQLSLGVIVILFSEKKSAALVIPVAGVSLFVVLAHIVWLPQDVFLRTINTYHYPSKIVYIEDDATGTVTVHDLPDGDRLIAVDGVDVAGKDLMLRTTQMLQGYIPLLIHPNPQKVVQIGFGSGETSRVCLAFGIEDFRIVEVCPGVFKAGSFFEDINKGSYKDPRLKKIIMDGKNFIKLTDEKFDVIMNDATYPGTTGSSALYTYDHFKQCRDRLKPNGVLSCWLPLDLRPEDLQLIIRSFRQAMPHCSLWMAANCLNKHSVLVGTLSPTRIDFTRIKTILDRPHVRSDMTTMNPPGPGSPYDLLDCFVLDERALSKIAGPGPLNTDDKPSLEFTSAIKRDEDGCLLVALSWISAEHSSILPYLTPGRDGLRHNLGQTQGESEETATLNQYYSATKHTLRGLLGILHGDPQIMNIEFALAQKANPLDRDVNSCLAELHQEINALLPAVDRTPNDASLRARLAKRYFLLEDYKRARQEYESYLTLDSHNAAAWNNLGICYNRMNLPEKAVHAFEMAAQHDSQAGGIAASALLNLGQLHAKLNEFAAAAQSFEKALTLSYGPQKAAIYDRLAGAYTMQGQYDRAMTAIDQALEIAPEDPAFRDHLQQQKHKLLQAVKSPPSVPH
jgi:spermidine synthase